METLMKVATPFDYDLIEKKSINKFRKINLPGIETRKKNKKELDFTF
jgi:hypothetical protein